MGDWVPVRLGVSVVGSVALVGVNNGRKAGGDDDSLDAGSILLDRLEDSGCSNVRWVEEFLLTVSSSSHDLDM